MDALTYSKSPGSKNIKYNSLGALAILEDETRLQELYDTLIDYMGARHA